MKISDESINTTTPAQIAANRANAQRSTGPKTAAGKAASAMNHFRHGFTGVFRVLAWENRAEFDTLIDGLLEEHKPSTVTETVLVEKMAQALWLSRRAQTLQHATFKREVPGCWDEKELALYIRYQTTNDRAFHKCLNDLLKVRAEKRKQDIGFESQERKRNEESRKRDDQARRAAAENRKQDLHKWRMLIAEAQLSKSSQSAIMSQSAIRPQNSPTPARA